jgi:hypothetical protein
MNEKKQFHQFYDDALMVELRALERLRLQAVKKIFNILIPYVLAALAAAFVIQRLFGKGGTDAMAIGGFIGVGIYLAIKKKFVDEYKDKVIKKMVAFVAPDLKYDKNRYVAEEKFHDSCLFAKEPNRYYGSDYVFGKVGQTLIEFSELHAVYMESSTKKQDVPIFHGLFFIADFNKHFKGKTMVLPDKAESMLGQVVGSFFQKMFGGSGELVKLEDPEFERLFVVYGDDNIEARYILTSSLMQRIIALKKKANSPVSLSFVRSRVYIAIATSQPLFEPDLFQSAVNSQEIERFFEDMKLAIGIVEDLNLNTRIWSK